MKIYTIHDAAAKFYLPLFLARNDEAAKRMFETSLGDSFVHRVDYALFQIGEFNEQQGTIETMTPQLVLAGGSIPVEHHPQYDLFKLQENK